MGLTCIVISQGDSGSTQQTVSDLRGAIATLDNLPVPNIASLDLQTEIQVDVYHEKNSVFNWAQFLKNVLPTTDSEWLLIVKSGIRLSDTLIQRFFANDLPTDTISLSPLVVRGQALSAFSDHKIDSSLSLDDIDYWLNQFSTGKIFDVPFISKACALINLKQLSTVLTQDVNTTDQLLKAVEQDGKLLLATDGLLVDDRYLEAYSEFDTLKQPSAYLDAFNDRNPLAYLRHPLTELAQRSEKPPEVIDVKPAQLHVAHSWGGGLGRWVEDYIEGDQHHNNWVLRQIGDWDAVGQTLALYAGAESSLPVRSWTLSKPILSTDISNYEYRQILKELVEDFRIESIIVSTLIGQSMDLLKTGLPTTVVLHDYYPFCPALYATFEQPCITCTKSRLEECDNRNDLNHFFNNNDIKHWLAIRDHLKTAAKSALIKWVAPSESVISRYSTLIPEMQNIELIPHGVKVPLLKSLSELKPKAQTEDTESEKLTILMLGTVSPQKGSDILTTILPELTTFAHLVLLGTGEGGKAFESIDGVTVYNRYHWSELPEYISNIQPDLGMILSTVPETFSYTLSEFYAAKVPVLATSVGALTERVIDDHTGWRVDPEPESALKKLQWVDANRYELSRVAQNLIDVDTSTTVQMANEYAQLHDSNSCVSSNRYRLPRKRWNTAVAQEEETRALYINHQVAYRQVLAEFIEYTRGKLVGSPRVPRLMASVINRVLRQIHKRL